MSKQRFKSRVLDSLRSLDDRVYEGSHPLRILFLVTDSYGFSCLAPVMNALEMEHGVYLGTTVDKPRTLDKVKIANPNERKLFNKYFIRPQKATLMKWHLVVNTHLSSFYSKRNALRIGIHHGPGFGAMGSKIHLVQSYDVFLGLSTTERGYLERIDPKVFDESRAFFAVGFPKSDVLVNSSKSTKNKREDFGLVDRPTILIASHWESVSILRAFGHLPFEILSKNLPQCNIIQTGHPWLWEGRNQRKGSRDTLLGELKRVAKQYENSYFLPHENAEQLLSISDILISDHSSILTTFSLLDRPIVWFENPKLDFAINEIKTIYRDASITFTKPEELPDICREALAQPDNKAEGRKKMRDTFHANPGGAAKKAAEILCAIGAVCSNKSPGWERIMGLSKTPAHLAKNPGL